jgi:hypothetical protein
MATNGDKSVYFTLLKVTINPTPVKGAERSKECTVFARLEAGIVGPNPTRSMDLSLMFVCVCGVFCDCVQVEALRRAEHPPTESYRMS